MKTNYYIHSRRLIGGGGVCRVNGVYELLLDESSRPYADFATIKEAQEVADELNARYPAADLIVVQAEYDPQ